MASIIFLNLLIATMNSTVQKMEDQKDMYWTYTRSAIWMEHFDFVAAFPPPFSLVMLFWMTACTAGVMLGKAVSHLYGLTASKAKKRRMRDSHSSENGCR